MGWNGHIIRLNLPHFLNIDLNHEDFIKRGIQPSIANKHLEFVAKIKKNRGINSQDLWDLYYFGKNFIQSEYKTQSFAIDKVDNIFIWRGSTTHFFFHVAIPFLLENVSKETSRIWKKLVSGEEREPETVTIDDIQYKIEIGEKYDDRSFIIDDEIKQLKDAVWKIVDNKRKYEELLSNLAEEHYDPEPFSDGRKDLVRHFKNYMYLELLYLMFEFSREGDIVLFNNSY